MRNVLYIYRAYEGLILYNPNTLSHTPNIILYCSILYTDCEFYCVKRTIYVYVSVIFIQSCCNILNLTARSNAFIEDA